MIIGRLNRAFSIICFVSVLFLSILSFVYGKIVDRSLMCTKGRHLEIRLTHSMGLSDSYIVLIANRQKLNCSFNFSVDSEDKGVHMILVVELPDWRPGWHVCGNDSNEIIVTVRDSDTVDVCKYLKEKFDDIYHVLVKQKAGVKVLSQGGMHSIKITATSVRDSSVTPCSPYLEVECKKNNHTYCMINVLKCDGDFNCGVKNKFDEDKLMCYGYEQLSWLNVILIMITTVITIFLIFALIRNCLPKKQEILIYHGKQTFTEGFEDTRRPFVVEVETRYLDHAIVQRRVLPVGSLEDTGDLEDNRGILSKRSSKSLTIRTSEM